MLVVCFLGVGLVGVVCFDGWVLVVSWFGFGCLVICKQLFFVGYYRVLVWLLVGVLVLGLGCLSWFAF